MLPAHLWLHLLGAAQFLNVDNPSSCPELAEGYEGEDLLPSFPSRPDLVLGRALALVEQIRSSLQARAYLEKLAFQEKLKPLRLKTWSQTRWGGLLFAIIECLLYLWKVSCSWFRMHICTNTSFSRSTCSVHLQTCQVRTTFPSFAGTRSIMTSPYKRMIGRSPSLFMIFRVYASFFPFLSFSFLCSLMQHASRKHLKLASRFTRWSILCSFVRF